MKIICFPAFLVSCCITTVTSAPLGSAFTYQGRLAEGTNLATGSYEFGFYLYDGATSGNQIGDGIFPEPLSVSNGLFTATLDFGKKAMDGKERWIEIHVRTNDGTSAFSALLPRQPMHAAPYAFFARTAGSLKDTLPDAQLSTNIARLDGNPTFSGLPTFAASGAPFSVLSSATVSNLNADLLDGFDSTAFAPSIHEHDNAYWKLTGNGGTSPDGHYLFLGTTDNQSLEVKVNSQRALRIEPGESPNIIGGYNGNYVFSDTVGVTISGGGASNALNFVESSIFYRPDYATIGGGIGNTVGAMHSTISGGANNRIVGYGVLGDNTSSATISGGIDNLVSGGNKATIGGGECNQIPARCHTATIGGGASNWISGSWGTIAGGVRNVIIGDHNWGLPNLFSSILGGADNRIEILSSSAAIGGGSSNRIAMNAGGASITGGVLNSVPQSGSYAMVAGGLLNEATANAFAAGTRGKARHRGAFVWSDSQDMDFVSTTNDEVNFRCAGGVRFTSGSSDADQTVSWTPGSGGWNFSSDRNLKERIVPVDGKAALEKVQRLPITEWSYKGHTQRHIGAMAQDFHAAFPLNESDTTLNSVDLHGITMAAIQGLHELVREQKAELEDKKKTIQSLEDRLGALERVIATLTKP